MFDSDSELESFALNSWANEIETGSTRTSAADLRERDQPKNIKVLTKEQDELVSRIRELAVVKIDIIMRPIMNCAILSSPILLETGQLECESFDQALIIKPNSRLIYNKEYSKEEIIEIGFKIFIISKI